MAGQKLTEKTVTTTLKDEAHVVITQKETVSGAEVESVRRIPINDFVEKTQSELKADLNDVKHDTETLNDRTDKIDERKANIDGYYSDMSVGLAENLISPDGVMDSEPYIYRTTAGEQSVTDGFAKMKAVKGNTLVWNQLIRNMGALSGYGLTIKDNADGSLDITGTVTEKPLYGQFQITQQMTFDRINSHTYFVFPNQRITNVAWGISGYGEKSQNVEPYLYKFDYRSSDWEGFICLLIDEGQTLNIKGLRVGVVDLTVLFGEGLEPTNTSDPRIAWLEAELDKHPEYNESTLLNVDVDGIKSVGFNQFDDSYLDGFSDFTKVGEHAYSGTINQWYNNSYITNNVFSKIRYLANTSYYIAADISISGNHSNNNFRWRVTYADGTTDDSQHINGTMGEQRVSLLTSSNKTIRSIGFYYGNEAGDVVTIKNICINLSWSGYRNGEYEPYWTQTRELPPIKEIRDADGNQLFPNGLLSAGGVRDEITPTKAIKRVGAVDLGSLAWFYSNALVANVEGMANGVGGNMPNAVCNRYPVGIFENRGEYTNSTITVVTGSNRIDVRNVGTTDPAAFKSAVTGVMLNYELETPIEIEFPEPYNLSYRISDFGTEEFVTSAEMTAPVAHDTFYMSNLRDEVRRLPNNYQSQDSMSNLLAALGQAFGCTITATWDEATKAYKYTVTVNGQTMEVNADE